VGRLSVRSRKHHIESFTNTGMQTFCRVMGLYGDPRVRSRRRRATNLRERHTEPYRESMTVTVTDAPP